VGALLSEIVAFVLDALHFVCYLLKMPDESKQTTKLPFGQSLVGFSLS